MILLHELAGKQESRLNIFASHHVGKFFEAFFAFKGAKFCEGFAAPQGFANGDVMSGARGNCRMMCDA